MGSKSMAYLWPPHGMGPAQLSDPSQPCVSRGYIWASPHSSPFPSGPGVPPAALQAPAWLVGPAVLGQRLVGRNRWAELGVGPGRILPRPAPSRWALGNPLQRRLYSQSPRCQFTSVFLSCDSMWAALLGRNSPRNWSQNEGSLSLQTVDWRPA